MRRAVLFGLVLIVGSRLPAQVTFAVEGYVTSAHLPASFQAGGRTVVLTRQTAFGFTGSDIISAQHPARQSLRVGAYVQVAGSNEDFVKPIAATEILVRDDAHGKLSGIGVISRVVSPEPDPVYEADGYQIQITPATKVAFAGDLDSLRDITVNDWIHFTGKRNANGILEASHVQFIPPKPTKFKAIKGVEVQPVEMRPANAPSNFKAPAASAASNSFDGASLAEDEKVKNGLLGRWHTIPADQPLQQRVHRIGMAMVPEYQRQMDDADTSKIHFRFFAVDDKKLRTAEVLQDGIILVSMQMIERLRNDDQLAAVLGDGIASNLQRQGARVVADNRILFATGFAEAAFPPLALGGFVHSGSSEDLEEKLQEERLRIALALMKDAGYDPWQAPEAWRLLEPKKLPANLASLEYPETSAYQIGILDLQYPRGLQQQKQ
ncbi:MAG TPA: DUF5666 domain-containing protein [Terracidiphilus sp.]|nr:DUF5666 domain-containing protein [Terracidiphilus sp.]